MLNLALKTKLGPVFITMDVSDHVVWNRLFQVLTGFGKLSSIAVYVPELHPNCVRYVVAVPENADSCC